jgi:HEAT repeat protein
MKMLPLAALAVPLLLNAPALAHGGGFPPPKPPTGGTYSGPGDTVPGGGGTGGPTGPVPSTPAPAGPSTPAPRGPATPAPGTSPPGPMTPSPGQSLPDLSDWSWWWNFNRDPYLELKRAIHAGAVTTGSDEFFLGHGAKAGGAGHMPSGNDIKTRIGPALQAAIEGESWTIQTDSMLAIAKLRPAFDPEGKSLVELISQHLDTPNQKLSESAIVALGLTGDFESVGILADIAADNEAGRKLMNRSSVPGRTRPLAALALGVLGEQLHIADARRILVGRLGQILREDSGASPDLHVACITAIGMTPLPELSNAPILAAKTSGRARQVSPTRSRQAQIQFLIEILKDEGRREYVRAHVPKALGRLAADASEGLCGEVQLALVEEFKRRASNDRLVRYGLVEALGMIGDADEGGSDQKVREILHKSLRNGDNSERGLASIAIALGSSRRGESDQPYAALAGERKLLLKQLATGKSRLRPWTALALGVQTFHANRGGQPESREVISALLQTYKKTRNPTDAGAWSIALGLTRNASAREPIHERLDRLGNDEARGYAAVALGLLGDKASVVGLEGVLNESTYHPLLLRKSATGLALLGEKSVGKKLVEGLAQGKSAAVKSSSVAAIGLVGDAQVINPLLEILKDEQQLDTSRRFAAIAVGVVCEPSAMPWTASLMNHLNYFAMTDSLLSGSGTGVLNLR